MAEVGVPTVCPTSLICPVVPAGAGCQVAIAAGGAGDPAARVAGNTRIGIHVVNVLQVVKLKNVLMDVCLQISATMGMQTRRSLLLTAHQLLMAALFWQLV